MTNKNDIVMKADERFFQKTAIVTTSGAVLGAVIIKLRIDKGINQRDLAAIVGIVPSTWSRIERGESGLSIEQLKTVAKALDETPWHILQMADVEENELKKRGVYIDESSSSPKALSDSLNMCTSGSLNTRTIITGPIGDIDVVVPIAGVTLASMMRGISTVFVYKDKIEEK